MKRALLLILLLSVAALAQDAPRQPVEVVAPSIDRWPLTIVFVIDASSSMDANNAFGRAQDAVVMIAELQGVDEWRMGIVAFGLTGARWEGEDGDGWSSMPSATAIEAGGRWLSTVDVGDSTRAWAGIHLAVQDVPSDGMVVVVVSDGYWQDGYVVLREIPSFPSRIVVATFSVGSTPGSPTSVMKDVGRIGGGGCWE